MSPAQKTLGVAALGIQGFRGAGGKNLGEMTIIKPEMVNGKVAQPGLNVGQALNMLNLGINAYSVIKNWDQLNTIQKVAAGTGMASDIASLSKSFGLIGQGVNDAAVDAQSVAQVSGMLQSGAATALPEAGVGALQVSANTALPQGYQVISAMNDGTKVIAPAANAGTSAVDVLGYAAGGAAVLAGTYQVAKGWGQGGTKGAVNGVLGGSGIAAGLYALGMSSWAGPAAPFVAAGIIATSVLGDTLQAGKSKNQNQRDSYRSFLQEAGIADGKYNVTLSDGTLANIGIDGHGGLHTARDPSKLVDQSRAGDKKLNAWDVDYTNDLDYTASMGTSALMRIVTGGKEKGSEQLGGELANAMLGNIGYGQDMTPENYNKLMQNLRGTYAKAGIKDKTTAYQLANKAYAEGRMNETDLIAAQQAFNMIYDNNSMPTALKLMAGRQKGIEVAANNPTPSGYRPPEQIASPQQTWGKKPLVSVDTGKPVPSSVTAGGLVPYSSGYTPQQIRPAQISGKTVNQYLGGTMAAPKLAYLSKADIKARNKLQYARA